MSLSSVFIDFARVFARGQAYTALSRVKTLSCAFFANLKLRDLQQADATALAFDASMRENV